MENRIVIGDMQVGSLNPTLPKNAFKERIGDIPTAPTVRVERRGGGAEKPET